MVILRCTRKLLKVLDVKPGDTLALSTNLLGEWYANLVPTIGGDLVVFANARTLLSVAIPTSALPQLVPLFAARVYNLLRVIDVPERFANLEIAEYENVLFAKTADRRVLGCLNEIARYYQYVAENHEGDEMISLMSVETELSRYIYKLTGYRYPAEIALELLTQDQMPLF
jgi:hypothetical protein